VFFNQILNIIQIYFTDNIYAQFVDYTHIKYLNACGIFILEYINKRITEGITKALIIYNIQIGQILGVESKEYEYALGLQRTNKFLRILFHEIQTTRLCPLTRVSVQAVSLEAEYKRWKNAILGSKV
jgi:hypothetical protein